METQDRPDLAGMIDRPFWEGLYEQRLLMTRCPDCRRWIWPAQWRCAECGSWDVQWEDLPARGTIYSWTRTYNTFMPQFADLVPYVNVLVELPDTGGRRMFGRLVGPDDVRIGDEVEGVFESPSERTEGWPALCWRLVDSDRAAPSEDAGEAQS